MVCPGKLLPDIYNEFVRLYRLTNNEDQLINVFFVGILDPSCGILMLYKIRILVFNSSVYLYY